MSAIYGMVSYDGNPNKAATVKGFGSQLVHYGPDLQFQWENAGVVLGQNILSISGEEVDSKFPFAIPGVEHVHIAADARIDYRDGLIKKLGNQQYRSFSDAQLILLAYLKWGAKDCCKHLMGEFAFVIWNSITGELLVGRDQLGLRSLYYVHNKSGSYFCTRGKDLKAVLENIELDELFCVETLCQKATTRSFVANISQVPPASVIIFTQGGSTTVKYHEFSPKDKLHYKNDTDYIDHIRQVFSDSVLQQARSIHPIAASLSGGLDSTSICYSLRDKLPAGQKKLYTFTAYPNDPGEQDSDFIADTIREPWIQNEMVKVDPEGNYGKYVNGIRSLQEPLVGGNLMIPIQLFERARQLGAKSYFNGEGAELSISNYGYEEMTYLLSRNKLLTYQKLQRRIGNRSYIKSHPVLPTYVKFIAKQIKPKWLFLLTYPKDITVFKKYKELIEDSIWNSYQIENLAGTERMTAQINQMVGVQSTQSYRNFIFEYLPIEICCPYSSVPMLQLGLDIPMAYRLRSFEPRGVARKVFANFIPESVVKRKEKAYFIYHFQYFTEQLDLKACINPYPSLFKDISINSKNFLILQVINLLLDENVQST